MRFTIPVLSAISHRSHLLGIGTMLVRIVATRCFLLSATLYRTSAILALMVKDLNRTVFPLCRQPIDQWDHRGPSQLHRHRSDLPANLGSIHQMVSKIAACSAHNG